MATQPNNGPVSPFDTDSSLHSYTVDIGGGRTVTIEGPAGATAEQLQQVIQSNPDLASSAVSPLADGAGQSEAPDQTQGGFADELPPQPLSKLSPQDEAQYQALLHTGTADQIRSFLAERAYSPEWDISGFTKARDKAIASGHPDAVNYAVTYALPKVETTTGGALGRGALDAGTLGFADELHGAAKGAAAALSGGNFSDAYNETVDQDRALAAGDEENHTAARLAGQLLAGIVLPAGAERAGIASALEATGLAAGKAALREGLSLPEARAIASRAVARRVIAEGAGYGAAYGTGEADGGPGKRLLGAATGAASGAVGAGLASAAGKGIGSALAKRAASKAASGEGARQFADAAERQGIDYLAADRPDALPSQWATSLTNLTLGGIPLTEAAQKTVATAKAARDRIAQGLGFVRDATGAGEAAQAGARKWMDATQGRASKLYDAIPIPNERLALLSGTKQALGDLTTGLKSNAELSKLISDKRLQGYADAIEGRTEQIPTGILDAAGNPITKPVQRGGALSWEDLKKFRTYVGELAGKPSMQSDTSQQALQRLYGALSQDMKATATQQGGGAVTAFNRANTYWRGRQARIDSVVTPILGKNLDQSGEQALKRIQQWAKADTGDFVKTAKLFRSLPQEEADSVRASIVSRLGRVSKGRQDETGDVFSPSDFVTHWNDLDSKAKSVLFPGELRKDLDDIVKVASGMKASGKYANTSKTGIAIGATGTIGSLVSNPVLGALGVVGQIGAGKLLGNPRFAKWLAGLAKKPNPSATMAHIQRLSAIARSEPAIANDILNLQERLAGAFASTPAQVAANEPGNSLGEADRSNAIGAGQQDQQEFRP